MRTTTLCIVAGLVLSGCAATNQEPRVHAEPPAAKSIGSQVSAVEPEITLIDSVERVSQYLETEAKQDYSDKYLHSVRYHFSDGHPRKGPCWLYHFAFKTPRLGGEVSVYHFMDGEILEFHHGP